MKYITGVLCCLVVLVGCDTGKGTAKPAEQALPFTIVCAVDTDSPEYYKAKEEATHIREDAQQYVENTLLQPQWLVKDHSLQENLLAIYYETDLMKRDTTFKSIKAAIQFAETTPSLTISDLKIVLKFVDLSYIRHMTVLECAQYLRDVRNLQPLFGIDVPFLNFIYSNLLLYGDKTQISGINDLQIFALGWDDSFNVYPLESE